VKIGRYIVPRLIGWLIGVAVALTLGTAALVYSGQEHREAVTSIAREFFILMEKDSRAKSPTVNASPTPMPEEGIIQ
jgi:hypothetical protein